MTGRSQIASLLVRVACGALSASGEGGAMKKYCDAALGIALALLSAFIPAQDSGLAWPARTVRLVVPSSPGGGTDLYARLLAQGLTEGLKQQFIIDNRPGAAGN